MGYVTEFDKLFFHPFIFFITTYLSYGNEYHNLATRNDYTTTLVVFTLFNNMRIYRSRSIWDGEAACLI